MNCLVCVCENACMRRHFENFDQTLVTISALDDAMYTNISTNVKGGPSVWLNAHSYFGHVVKCIMSLGYNHHGAMEIHGVAP